MNKWLKTMGMILMVLSGIVLLILLITAKLILFPEGQFIWEGLAALLLYMAGFAGLFWIGQRLYFGKAKKKSDRKPDGLSGTRAASSERITEQQKPELKDASSAAKEQNKAAEKSAQEVPAEEHKEEAPGKKAPGKKEPGQKGSDKKETEKPEGPGFPEQIIDDISYIQDMKHGMAGAWHRFDVLLAAAGYGWGLMLDWAAYMEKADLDDVGTLTTAEMANLGETEWIEEYRKSGKALTAFEPLLVEQGQLGIGGISRTMREPVKIVWFNQTRALRVYSLTGDEERMNRYVETMVRRTFGTPDAMKRAKPVPKKDEEK